MRLLRSGCIESVRQEVAMAVEWRKDVDAAMAEAKTANKPVLLDFSAAPA